MAIRFPQGKPVEVRGRLTWSNLNNIDSNNSPYAGMGFSFVKISDEDRLLLNDIVTAHSH